MSEKEVKVDQSLLDDGSYLEEEPKNNKVLFIVLGLVVTALAVAGGVMMSSGGEEATVLDQPTTPSLTLTENQTQTEELPPIELTIETEPKPEIKEDRSWYVDPEVDEEYQEQARLEGEIHTLITQMDRESETQAEQRVELMEQAGYEIDDETQVITAPNGNTIEADGKVTNTEGVVVSDNSMETNTDGTHTVVYQGVTYNVTQAQYDEATSGRGVSSVDGIPADVFLQIQNVGVTLGSNDLTVEEFREQYKDSSLDSSTTVTWG